MSSSLFWPDLSVLDIEVDNYNPFGKGESGETLRVEYVDDETKSLT